jgi:hypothetical protein
MYQSWNEEGMLAYIKEFRQAAKALIGSEWAIISIFEDWELGHPDMDKHVIEHCEWFIKNGCIRDCHVYSSAALKSAQLEKTAPLNDGSYQRCVFQNIAAATKWLEEEGFQTSSIKL